MHQTDFEKHDLNDTNSFERNFLITILQRQNPELKTDEKKLNEEVKKQLASKTIVDSLLELKNAVMHDIEKWTKRLKAPLKDVAEYYYDLLKKRNSSKNTMVFDNLTDQELKALQIIDNFDIENLLSQKSNTTFSKEHNSYDDLTNIDKQTSKQINEAEFGLSTQENFSFMATPDVQEEQPILQLLKKAIQYFDESKESICFLFGDELSAKQFSQELYKFGIHELNKNSMPKQLESVEFEGKVYGISLNKEEYEILMGEDSFDQFLASIKVNSKEEQNLEDGEKCAM